MKVHEVIGQEEPEYLFEMATLGPSDHEFSVDIKLNVLQPGDKKLQHGPRIKCLKRGIPGNFSIALHLLEGQVTLVQGSYESFLSTDDYNTLLLYIRKYRLPFLEFWHDPTMSVEELRDKFREVDANTYVFPPELQAKLSPKPKKEVKYGEHSSWF